MSRPLLFDTPLTPAERARRYRHRRQPKSSMYDLIIDDALTALRTLPADQFQCSLTSPPYFGLRRYTQDGAEIGQEDTPAEYVSRIVEVMREVRRVLRPDGTAWVNVGDSYCSNASTSTTPRGRQGNGSGAFHIPDQKHADARRATPNRATKLVAAGHKKKDLLLVPHRLAIALSDDGWYLRSDIIWHKSNPQPENCVDRPTQSHEHVLLLSRSARYYYDAAAIAEPAVVQGGRPCGRKNDRTRWDGDRVGIVRGNGETRNARNVWSIATGNFRGAHYATMPAELARRCIAAGSRRGDQILDPFAGSGTTGLVAEQMGRDATLIELSPEYGDLIRQRCAAT